jgi:DNA repair protein RadD
VQRHGFIDQVKPKKAGGSGDGEAPAKECPNCQHMLPTATRVCPECNYEFPAPELNHAQKSYGGAMLSSQVQMEWLDVDDVFYQRWEGKAGKRDTLRVTYDCGVLRVSEWLCPDHGGYAAERYRARLPSLGGQALTLDEAILEARDWVKPSRIRVKPDGKFHHIVQFDYTQKEKTHAEKAAEEHQKAILAEFEGEIPF